MLPEPNLTPVSDQIAVLNELRTSHDASRGVTPAQLQAVNILLTSIVGKDYRMPVLRLLLGYDGRFTSTKQLTFADAHAIIEWAYQGQSPARDLEPGRRQQLALNYLKSQIEIDFSQA